MGGKFASIKEGANATSRQWSSQHWELITVSNNFWCEKILNQPAYSYKYEVAKVARFIGIKSLKRGNIKFCLSLSSFFVRKLKISSRKRERNRLKDFWLSYSYWSDTYKLIWLKMSPNRLLKIVCAWTQFTIWIKTESIHNSFNNNWEFFKNASLETTF